MKLYTPPPPDPVIRVCIKRSSAKPEYLTLCDCKDRVEAAKWFKEILLKDSRVTPFILGDSTNVQFREALGSENGLSLSVAFRGLSPIEVKELIIKNLSK